MAPCLQPATLTERLRHLAPEAIAFGVIGAGNTLLYMAITWAALPIGAVKASVIATVVTTTLAYFANRYSTYRHHTRTRAAPRVHVVLRVQPGRHGDPVGDGGLSASTASGSTSSTTSLAFMGSPLIGIVIATVFRFWAYRTFVFLKPPVDGHEADLADLDAVAGLAELAAEGHSPAEAQLAADPPRGPLHRRGPARRHALIPRCGGTSGSSSSSSSSSSSGRRLDQLVEGGLQLVRVGDGGQHRGLVADRVDGQRARPEEPVEQGLGQQVVVDPVERRSRRSRAITPSCSRRRSSVTHVVGAPPGQERARAVPDAVVAHDQGDRAERQ